MVERATVPPSGGVGDDERVVPYPTSAVNRPSQGEDTFRLMVEAVQDYAIFMLDTEGVVVSWNSGAERMKGYQPEEIQGQHFSRFYPPEDVQAGKPAEALRAAAALGRREDEGWRVRKDGSRFWASVVITAVRDPAGCILGFTKVTRDFTGRRRAQAQLQAQARLLELVHDAVVATNQDQILIAWNEGAHRLYGWRADEVLGRPIIDVLKTEFLEGSRDEALRVVEEGGEWRGEVVQRHKSGQRLEVEAAVIVTHQGSARMVAVNRDIGERKRALVMEERARIARDLHDSVSQALFSITLHARGLELALQSEGHSPDGLRSRVASIRQLTQGAQAEMRALIFELRPDSLAEEGLVAALRRHAVAIEAKELVTVVVSAPSEYVPFGPVTEEHLYRLAQEALNNVVKHARATTVEVRLTVPQSGSRRIELEVADDGIGFDVGVKRPGHLGLMTMSERAASLGGVLEVTSSPGTGTVIRAILPWDGQDTLS